MATGGSNLCVTMETPVFVVGSILPGHNRPDKKPDFASRSCTEEKFEVHRPALHNHRLQARKSSRCKNGGTKVSGIDEERKLHFRPIDIKKCWHATQGSKSIG
jgi:hypothetical protein